MNRRRSRRARGRITAARGVDPVEGDNLIQGRDVRAGRIASSPRLQPMRMTLPLLGGGVVLVTAFVLHAIYFGRHRFVVDYSADEMLARPRLFAGLFILCLVPLWHAVRAAPRLP